ncbi:DUF1697 domain-containing protein [Marixanthomonas sp. SCSIO 43207]|uniref:DUF1697 domain-containing protein n=1 Tax=Marixanthomonas sp. SCSIO 43207 TaxID=2779360 RepID=UPI001CA8682B|nr:DUF1697 domain-containing protein [Marixanthomonas sp. SCSIO 43207]UAB82359.1 DUF1697 domain-containing protein [Marixanthomonas sp. SCSIO 43207]
MTTYIALLRGINVGGHKKFTKAQQLEMLSGLGYDNTKVYLHTGNWIFETSEREEAIAQHISEAIQAQFGWKLPILVLPLSEIETIFQDCPFSEEKKKNSYFIILSEQPNEAFVKEVALIQYSNEEVVIKDRCIYFYSANGYGRTTFNMNRYEKKLNVQATSRNYNTMTTIIGMAG